MGGGKILILLRERYEGNGCSALLGASGVIGKHLESYVLYSPTLLPMEGAHPLNPDPLSKGHWRDRRGRGKKKELEVRGNRECRSRSRGTNSTAAAWKGKEAPEMAALSSLPFGARDRAGRRNSEKHPLAP